MTDTTPGAWQRAKPSSPCPICGKKKFCSITPRGDAVKCMHTPSPRAVQSGGWLHPIPDAPLQLVRDRDEAPRSSGIDWRAMVAKYASDITEQQIGELAAHLHVDAIAVREIGTGFDSEEGAFTMPMHAADGAVCGLQRRFLRAEGDFKKAATGCKLGVFRRSAPADASDGVLLICEGASDTLVALSLGFDAIGAASAGSCVDIVPAYADGRDVVIVQDNNEEGASHAAKLAVALRDRAKSVRIVVPKAKDLRAWHIAGAKREDIEAAIAAAKVIAEKPRGRSPLDVLERWRREGRLVHQPTGIAALDQQTRGGPIYGQLWGVLGPPDAAKTALIVEIGANLAAAGVLVAFHALDEDDDGLLTRFAQRAGIDRFACEQRDTWTLQAIQDAMADLPVMFFGDEHTIEAAAEEVAAEASRQGRPGAYLVDSLQVANSAGTKSDGSQFEKVSAGMVALRTVARRHKLITFFTSEQNRESYKGAARDKSLSEMSAGKGSGDIEYKGKVQLSLRATDELDQFELRITKNKHGRRTGPREAGIFLQLDRDRQRLTETNTPAAPASQEPAVDDVAAILRKNVERVTAGLLSLPNCTATSKAAIYAAAGMKPANGLSAVDWMISMGLIVPGGTTREPTYTLAPSARVQSPPYPYGNAGNAFPCVGNGNGNERERERDRDSGSQPDRDQPGEPERGRRDLA